MTTADLGRLDGIRTNGTEATASGLVQTYEVWRDGKKVPGPSPNGNFWLYEDAENALHKD